MSVKLLTEQCLEALSLKGGHTGLSEATLVKMSHCWKSLVMALFCSTGDSATMLRETLSHLFTAESLESYKETINR